jgi:hypothetical protein
MNTSQKKLKECLRLYLNDIEDYGEPEELMLAEAALTPFKTLLVESKSPTPKSLKEIYKNATPKNQVIIADFFSYYNNL